MPPKKKIALAKPTKKKGARRPLEDEVEAVVASLKRLGTKQTRDGMARYGIPSDKAFGVSMGTMQEQKRFQERSRNR